MLDFKGRKYSYHLSVMAFTVSWISTHLTTRVLWCYYSLSSNYGPLLTVQQLLLEKLGSLIVTKITAVSLCC